MAGIFGFFDYTKPGKGVDPNEPKKKAFFRFWELFGRKFWRLILLNLIYFVSVLPMLAYVYYIVYGYALQSLIGSGQEYTLPPLAQLLISMVLGLGPAFYVLLVLSALLFGPVTCGFSFMMRNFVREEHAWLGDFYEHARRNLRQGLIVGLIDIAIICLLVFNIVVAPGLYAPGETVGAFLSLARYVSVALLVVYSFMRSYFYTMIVTFDLKTKDVFKNGWIFAIVGAPRNLLVTAIIALLAGILLLVGNFLDLVLVPLIFFSFCGFLISFACYPLLKKHMIDAKPAEK